jgi:hypothetical protein
LYICCARQGGEEHAAFHACVVFEQHPIGDVIGSDYWVHKRNGARLLESTSNRVLQHGTCDKYTGKHWSVHPIRVHHLAPKR